MNIYVKILAISVGIVAVQHIAKLIYMDQSWGNTIISSHPGPCHIVQGFVTPGSEDMTLLPSGQLIISSGMEGFADSSGSYSHGAIYSLDTADSGGSAVKLNLKGIPQDSNFSPHGIHHWVHDNGSVSIFVVTHHPEAVFRFLYDGKKTLTLTKTYSNPTHMRNLNSIYVTGEDSFYISNIMKSQYGHKPSLLLEYILILPLSDIIYVKGDKSHVAVESLHIPNGLTGNGRFLYAATKDSIHIYTILPNGELKIFKMIPIAIGSMDNIKLDAAGDLWIGCQPILRNVLDYLEDMRKPCYSQILRVRNPEGKEKVESVFTDDGSLFNGVSVGLYHNRKLYMGTIHDKMAVCDVKHLMGE